MQCSAFPKVRRISATSEAVPKHQFAAVGMSVVAISNDGELNSPAPRE